MDYVAGEVIALIKTHPDWAALVIGLVAFGESFVFLSLLFPGTAILIASGALIEAGILDPLSPMFAGILGAVIGDAISFWLGHKFGPRILNAWLFRHRPQRLESGIVFFDRYGTASVSWGDSLVLSAQ
jgi:membrane protein DedA with SNARE-associated domain